MKNKVVFCNYKSIEKVADELGDCYILTEDNWDDYGYKTYFHVNIFKNGERYEDLARKILFEKQDDITSSSSFLEKKLDEKLFIQLNELDDNFISLGYDYVELKKIFPENFEDVLDSLNDVIYLMKREN